MHARVAAIAILAVLFSATHAVLDRAARVAERDLGAFLWKQHDTLRLFSPHNYVNRGRGRLLIYGPSEAREGLLPEEISRIVSGLTPFQNSQSIGTLEDGLVIFDYIERAYGPTAIPDVIVLGITPRFISNLRSTSSPLFNAINRYSPHFSLDQDQSPPRLRPRTWAGAMRARAALLAVQPDRYRRGLFAIAAWAVARMAPSLAGDRRLWAPIAQAKYLDGKLNSDTELREWLNARGNIWDEVFRWDPAAGRQSTVEELRRLTGFVRRHGVQLYVVNLPQLSWVRDKFDASRYAAYLTLVREEFRDVPFLDLQTFLNDDEFFDTTHPTWTGGRRVSRRVAEFVEEHRIGRFASRTPAR